MARINGIRLARVAPELLERLRQYGEAEILWAWPVTRDGEAAVLAATDWGLRLVTVGGEQRWSWSDLGDAEAEGLTACRLLSDARRSLRALIGPFAPSRSRAGAVS